jgi:hypothetical protein
MATYTLISSNVLTTTAASVTFSAIPATFTDLVLRASIRTDSAATQDSLIMKLNNDSSALYSTIMLRGNGSSAISAVTSSETSINARQVDADTATSNTFSSTEIYIPSYTVSQNKPISIDGVQENNNAEAFRIAIASLYRSSTAISRIDFNPLNGTNFVSGSSFYLYGISNA